uniref:Uncharacterized protein n=1 Tax=Pristionchus pacificus TaxID=54126 RepID=A0A2A6C1E4_PRIPA|eukprot:PDM71936.1 hypothetical protein PRIPAC_38343 [Pristionchus pacificus]
MEFNSEQKPGNSQSQPEPSVEPDPGQTSPRRDGDKDKWHCEASRVMTTSLDYGRFEQELRRFLGASLVVAAVGLGHLLVSGLEELEGSLLQLVERFLDLCSLRLSVRKLLAHLK